MPLIRPFPGLRPAPGRADDVVAPPYDVLNTEEARERSVGRPWSFLHISKPEIDLPKDTDPFAAEVYEKGKDNFQRMLAERVLIQDDEPCYYLYRLIMGEHVQTGLVAAASVADYDGGRIRKHEFTRPDKEDDRVRQIDSLGAQTGPVFLAYRHNNTIDALVERLTAAAPDMDVTADDGVRHTLWAIHEPGAVQIITETFDSMERLYIADGHHRSAAASRVAAKRRDANPNHTGDEPYNYFLSVIFPDNQMQILDYNRVVTDLGGHSQEAFMEKVSEAFTVEPATEPVKPGRTGEFGHVSGRQLVPARHQERPHPRGPRRSSGRQSAAEQPHRTGIGHERPPPGQAHRFRRRDPRPQGTGEAGRQRRRSRGLLATPHLARAI